MIMLGPQGGWSGRRKGAPKSRVNRAADGEDDAGDSALWLADVGENGGDLSVGRAVLPRDYLPDAPDAFLEHEEASGELIGV